MRALRFAPVLALLALCFTTPALADLTFTFDSGANFSGVGGMACNASDDDAHVDFNCTTPYTLNEVYGSETLTLGQTRYYYLGSMQEDEDDSTLDASEVALGTTTFRVTFSTSFDSGFQLDIPVTPYDPPGGGVFYYIRVDTRGVVQYLPAGSEGADLIAQVRLTSTNPVGLPTNGSATGSTTCPSCLDPSYYDYAPWGDQTRYYYLALTYNTPEPATYVLIGSALVGLAFLRKRRA